MAKFEDGKIADLCDLPHEEYPPDIDQYVPIVIGENLIQNLSDIIPSIKQYVFIHSYGDTVI